MDPAGGADAEGEVHVRGAADLECRGAGELLELLDLGLALRSSEVTERNPISSRSHAVCHITLLRPGGDDEGGPAENMGRRDDASGDSDDEGEPAENLGRRDDASGDGVHARDSPPRERRTRVAGRLVPAGRLALVDLAGSERNYETIRMSAAQHKESGDINASLMALKDCFRAHAANAAAARKDMRRPHRPGAGTPSRGGRMPFRAHRLTQVLKACFTDPTHRTVLLATASPTATDVTHTRNTLDHVTMTSPDLSRPEARRAVTTTIAAEATALTQVTPVEQWTPEQVSAFVATTEAGRFADLVLPAVRFPRGRLIERPFDRDADLRLSTSRTHVSRVDCSSDGGEAARVPYPTGLDGKGLLSLTSARLASLFEGALGTRGAWVIGSGEAEAAVDEAETAEAAAAAAEDEEALRRRRRRRTIGEDLFLAVRRESQRIAQAENARRRADNGARDSRVDVRGGAREAAPSTVASDGRGQVIFWLDGDSPDANEAAVAEAQSLLDSGVGGGGGPAA